MEKKRGQRIRHRKMGQKAVLGEQEKRRLTQLILCLLLFCTLFYAKGRDRLAGFRQELSVVLETNADFQTAASDLSWAVDSGHPMGETLGRLLRRIVLPKGNRTVTENRPGPLYWKTKGNLGRDGVKGNLGRDGVKGNLGRDGVSLWNRGSSEALEDPMAQSGAWLLTEASLPAEEQEPEVVFMEYNGPTLPDNTTMDRYNLHLEETVSPVMAVMSSPFGWREHPIEGEERFHYGVDLASESGTPVLAYAGGVVDYIGESDVYGQYLQLRHGNGVTSFYAHCSKLCVQKGQKISAGEKVAESGATGEVTGPHLHFELKKDGVRLNPFYYIQTVT